MRVLDVANFVEQLFADAAFDPEFNTLIFVADDTDIPDISARDGLAQLLAGWRKVHIPAKWALIVSGSAWRRLAEHVIEQHDLNTRNVRCFRSSMAAILWFEEEVTTVEVPRGA